MSSECPDNMASWEQTMDTLYTYFYLFLFIPGLLLNTVALWVLCRHIRYSTDAHALTHTHTHTHTLVIDRYIGQPIFASFTYWPIEKKSLFLGEGDAVLKRREM